MTKSRLDNPFTKGQIAEFYARYNHMYHAYQDALVAFTGLVSLESKVLEIGVGTGAFTNLLFSTGYDVNGIDRSEEMLKRSPQRVRVLSEQCDLLDYNPSKKYDVVVSHSGGFTFKRGKFETYYQEEDDLEKAFQKIHAILGSRGEFFINKAEHDDKIDLGDGKKLSIKQEDNENSRVYTYTFRLNGDEITQKQRRLVFSQNELQEISSSYFSWNFDHNRWIVGEKK
jgi:SAM-dependent methyltransferase